MNRASHLIFCIEMTICLLLFFCAVTAVLGIRFDYCLRIEKCHPLSFIFHINDQFVYYFFCAVSAVLGNLYGKSFIYTRRIFHIDIILNIYYIKIILMKLIQLTIIILFINATNYYKSGFEDFIKNR